MGESEFGSEALVSRSLTLRERSQGKRIHAGQIRSSILSPFAARGNKPHSGAAVRRADFGRA